MTDKVLDWLLEKDNPSVRYETLTTLLGYPQDDAEVLAARQMIMTAGLVPSILQNQNTDGSWGQPDRFYNDKYTGTVWNLLLLAELAAAPDHPQIQNACEFIFHHAQNPETGGFSYTMSAKTGTGLASGIIPCLTGNMVYSLIRLGYLDDRRLQQAIDWIVTWQRADDGDADPPGGPVYDRYEMCWGRHSCHMGVAKALKALAAIPADRRKPAVGDKIDLLCEYFLKHHLYKKSHDLATVARPGWLKPGFPLMYQTDILELLDLFAGLDRWDPRLEDARVILQSKQPADGRWILENTFNGKMVVQFEQKGKPSKWLTLKALRILDRFSRYQDSIH
jgi:hypothetical protein